MINCENCKYCVLQDNGYSNYTVEGTDFECRKNVHPNGSFDRWYGDDARLEYAKKCEAYKYGPSIAMDVEHENYDALGQEQKDIFDGKL